MATERKPRKPRTPKPTGIEVMASIAAFEDDAEPSAPIASAIASVEGEEVQFAIHHDSRTGAMAAIAALVQKRTDDGEG